MLQGRARAVDLAHEGDVRYPPEFFQAHVHEPGEDPGEGIVDPDVDAAELFHGPIRRASDGIGVRYVGRNDERSSAKLLDFAGGGLEPLTPSRQKGDRAATPRELTGRRAADPSGGTGNDSDFRHLCALDAWRGGEVPLQLADRHASIARS